MGVFSKKENGETVVEEPKSQLAMYVSKRMAERIKWIRGERSTRRGRSEKDHDYESAFRRLFVFLDAVGWEPVPVGHEFWGDTSGYTSLEEWRKAYEDSLAEFEGKIGRGLKLHERVLFAQLKGWGRNKADGLVKREWILGPYWAEVKENLETSGWNLGEGEPEAPLPAAPSEAGEALE